MIRDALKKILDNDEREVKKLRQKVDIINKLEAEYKSLPAEAFPHVLWNLRKG